MLGSFTILEWLLLAVALQQGLFALAWLAVSHYLAAARRSAQAWALFCSIGAVSLVLLALRGHVPDALGYTAADVALIASSLAAWRASALFFDVANRGKEQAALLLLVAAAALALGTDPARENLRIALLFIPVGWVALRAVQGVHRPMVGEFGTTLTWSLHVPALLSGLFLLAVGIAAPFMVGWHGLDPPPHSPARILLVLGLLAMASCLSLIYAGMLIARLVRRLRDLALKDTLTGLFNRRAAQELLEREWKSYRQKDLPFCVLMIDIDHFKHINDAYGHAVGDKVLAGLAARLREGTRPSDHAARMGGEEFLIFLPQTEIASAQAAAERLRQHVAAWTLEPEHLSVTVSIGVAQAAAEDEAFDDLLIRADRALYAAKAAGRNRVYLAATIEAEVTSLATA